MTDHLITPPPELVQDWLIDGTGKPSLVNYLATQAAQWGADMELEACCEWMEWNIDLGSSTRLCSDRRPKPPSLKKQALAELELLRGDANAYGLGFDASAIRRALNELPND